MKNLDSTKYLFRMQTGSHLYGLNDEKSDIDYFSVFFPTMKDLFSLETIDEIDNSSKKSSSERRNTPEDVDDKAMILGKYLKLLLQNNPNILETLFATVNSLEEFGGEYTALQELTKHIISQKVYHSFGGYAISQKKKLEIKSTRYHSLVDAVEFLEKKYGYDPKSTISFYEGVAEDLNTLLKYYKGKKGNTEHFHIGMHAKVILDLLRQERDTYGWRVKTDTFEKLGFDVKFAYHLIRLLYEAEDLLLTGKLEFPFEGKRKELLMNIRHGEVTLDQIYKIYDELWAKVEVANEKTILPKKPNWKKVNSWYGEILKNRFIDELNDSDIWR